MGEGGGRPHRRSVVVEPLAVAAAPVAAAGQSPPHPGWAWAGLALRGWALGGWARAAVGYGPWHRAGVVLNGVLWVAEAAVMAARHFGGDAAADAPPAGAADGDGR